METDDCLACFLVSCVEMSTFFLFKVFPPVSLLCVLLPVCIISWVCFILFHVPHPSPLQTLNRSAGSGVLVSTLETDHTSPEMTTSLFSHRIPVVSVNTLNFLLPPSPARSGQSRLGGRMQSAIGTRVGIPRTYVDPRILRYCTSCGVLQNTPGCL